MIKRDNVLYHGRKKQCVTCGRKYKSIEEKEIKASTFNSNLQALVSYLKFFTRITEPLLHKIFSPIEIEFITYFYYNTYAFMKESLQGHPNQQEITGLKPDSNTIQKVDASLVLRDSRGRVLWRLPGNTPEQNEQLGIENIQALFLGKFPEFSEMFPREKDGKITEDKREKARKFILDKISTKKDFYIIIGISATSRNTAFYFDGSYVVALQKSFGEWAINIDQVGRKKVIGYWKPEKIEDEARRFYEREGKLTGRLLIQKKRSDIAVAINRHYPGKMPRLKETLGIIVKRKQNGYWTTRNIEQESILFHKNYGGLTQSLLTQHDRSDLLGAIHSYYPGQMEALKKKLGITSYTSEDLISPDQANEELMKFLEAKDE